MDIKDWAVVKRNFLIREDEISMQKTNTFAFTIGSEGITICSLPGK